MLAEHRLTETASHKKIKLAAKQPAFLFVRISFKEPLINSSIRFPGVFVNGLVTVS